VPHQSGTKIDIEDDGTIKVAAVDAVDGQKAIDWIKGIVAEPEVGVISTGENSSNELVEAVAGEWRETDR